jgi:protoporphyrinogen oxidase
MPKKSTKEEFIKISNKSHNNFYNYDNVIYIKIYYYIELMTTRRKNWEKILKEQEIKDNSEIITELTNKMNRNMEINFKCNCGETYEKTIRQIIEKSGLFCKECTEINKKKKYEKTCLETYGNEYPSRRKEFRENVKKTMLERYGVENPSQCKEFKDKKKKTYLKKFGVSCITQSEEFKKKREKTMLERYDVEHSSQCKEIREKIKKTNLERYGYENPSQCKEIREKIKKTNLERYGYENPSQCKEIREKIKKTNLERYGYENPLIEQYNCLRNNI